MVRKMVTGDARDITVHIKKESKEVECEGCGKKMTITVPHVGDILCDECMKGSGSYKAVVEG